MVDDGAGKTFDELIVAPAISTLSTGLPSEFEIESIDFHGGSLGSTVMRRSHAIADPPGYATVHSDVESVGDLNGDGKDEILSTADPVLAHDGKSHIEILTILGAGSAGTSFTTNSQIAERGRRDEEWETAVVDMRPVTIQRIAPPPGSGNVDPQSFPQVAIASPVLRLRRDKSRPG